MCSRTEATQFSSHYRHRPHGSVQKFVWLSKMSNCCLQGISEVETKCSNCISAASYRSPKGETGEGKAEAQYLVKITFITEHAEEIFGLAF